MYMPSVFDSEQLALGTEICTLLSSAVVQAKHQNAKKLFTLTVEKLMVSNSMFA